MPRHSRRAPQGEGVLLEKIRLIGSGSQGESWLMRLVSEDMLVVRKVFDRFLTDGEMPLEVRILNHVLPRHHSIIRIFDWIFHHGRLQIYYNYCAGGSLGDVVPEGNPGLLPEGFLWHVFLQLAEALEVLHHRGTQRVVHRDMKPDNVFLERTYEPGRGYPDVQLGDFGLATIHPVTARAGAALWLAPEPESTAKGDVWGLGAIIHALAHGVGPVVPLPAYASTRAQLQWMIDPDARRPRDLPAGYSDRLNRNMMNCLDRDPDDRVSSRKLVRDLRRDMP